MSLYNTIHGYNNAALLLLFALDLKPNDIPRFRDCWINTEEEKPRIVVFTRTGGNNRKSYQSYNDDLTKHPDYISDHDEGCDSTYAHFMFKLPDNEVSLRIIVLIEVGWMSQPLTFKERSDAFLEKMKDPNAGNEQ